MSTKKKQTKKKTTTAKKSNGGAKVIPIESRLAKADAIRARTKKATTTREAKQDSMPPAPIVDDMPAEGEAAAVWVSTSKLMQWIENPRDNDPAVPVVMQSIREHGFGAPLLARKANGEIIGGHTRIKAAMQLGLARVPVRYMDLTEEQAHKLAIIDNKSNELATWNDEMLRKVVADMRLSTLEGLTSLAFSEKEAKKFLATLAAPPAPNEDYVPEPPKEPVTRRGDLWKLGAHRLLCGDSTSADDVARLMNLEKADICFTSPPYALGKSVSLSGNKSMSARGNAYDAHEDTSSDWPKLMRGWFEASQRAVSNAWIVNVQMLAGNKRELVRFIAEHADRLIDIATWDKGHAAPAMAPGVMSSQFEWMLMFSAEAGASRAIPLASWRGTISNVYNAPAQRTNEFAEVHAATMPVHVPKWVLLNLCDEAKSVFEPFGGTGTTMIAAEQLGRRCFMMEISPSYCDVIVERWEKFTGQKAERVHASEVAS